MRKIHSESGNAAVEFALLAPILALLIAGLADYGEAVDISTELNMAARAGAQYATHYPSDTAGITSVVQNSTKNPSASFTVTAVTPTPSTGSQPTYCTCSDSSPALANQIDCTTGTCVSPNVKKYFVAVTATETYTPVLPYRGRFTAFTMAGTATVQVQ
jgi:Flp pilus assembly protein TadG